jgi:uncharacterized protein (TIGR02598 family)
MKIKMRVRGPEGFSLVEIMLALAIIAIGLIAIIGLIPQGIKSSRDASENTLVATIVHDTFNDLRRQALTPPWPPNLVDVYYDVAGTNQSLSPSVDTYYQVHLLIPQSTPTLLTISARITWPVKSVTAVPPNTNFFSTQIANYQQ